MGRGQEKGERSSGTLVLAAVFLEALAVFLSHLGVVIGQEELLGRGSNTELLVLQGQGIVLARYAIDPVMLFAAMFLLGRRVSLRKRYLGLSLALFISGFLGYYLGTIIGFTYDSLVGDLLSQDLSALRYLLGPLSIETMLTGVSTFFIGFCGLAYANFSTSDYRMPN